MSVGKIEPFQANTDNWALYVERLEQYFIVNGVKEEHKVPTLITVMGGSSYELLVTLCTPDKPSSKKFQELVKIMASHLQPLPSILAERYKFRKRKQNHSESIAEYVAELRRLSKGCGFREGLQESLRDQLVCGLHNDTIRQRLFTEEELSFESAFKLAIAIEAAEQNAAIVEGRDDHRGGKAMTSESTDCYAVSAGRRQRGQIARRPADRAASYENIGRSSIQTQGLQTSRNNYAQRSLDNWTPKEIRCDVCGRYHNASSCKFKNYVCRVCNQSGHLKRMCQRLKESSLKIRNGNNDVHEMLSDDSEEVNFNMFNASSINRSKPIMITVCIANKSIAMEADTGCAISCISTDMYRELFSDIPIQSCDVIMSYYTGEGSVVKGRLSVQVSYRKICKQLDLYIVDKGRKPLLGRIWLNELGFVLRTDCNDVKVSIPFSMETLSSRYSEVFSDGLGRYTGGEVNLRVRPDAKPIFMRARPLAYALRQPVERTLDQLVADGVITPVTSSDWATPIVPVVKPDGTIRVCGDFKLTLNKCLEVDRFPLPKIEDLLVKIKGGERYTKLDLSQAYAQLVLAENSKQYTVINTHRGLFKYNRLIYGLSSSPGIFQRVLEQMFADIPRVGIFIDDLILTGETTKEHMDTLHRVLERLQKFGLKLKKEKCSFFAKSVNYLGHIVDKEGIHTNPDKVEAIEKVKAPTTVSELRAFIGMVMYYGKFVKNISTILAPLYNLLKEGIKYEWSKECEEAFCKVKERLISSEVLAYYNPELPLILTTDASSVGVGAVISHVMPNGRERPIAYASRVLNSAERVYSQIDKEALAIIYGLKKFHQYLYGRKFLLRTDHKPLVSILGPKKGIPTMAASRMQRWALILSGYCYDIEYIRSEKNGADALSRLPWDKRKDKKREVTYVNFVNDFLPVTHHHIAQDIQRDNLLRKVVMHLQSGWPTQCKEAEFQPYFIKKNELYLDDGCIMWGYRIIIPTSYRKQILQELHLGHMGIVKMKSIARSYVWWPGIDADIENLCKGCQTCALEAPAALRAPPQPWKYPVEPWYRLHIDLLGPLKGKMFFVLIDASTKWIEVFQMTTTTASAVLKVLREIFARFGLPKEIVSDNGPPFTSTEMEKFMENNGIIHTFTPVYHPASNGAAEGAVKLCKRAIKKGMRDGQDIDISLQAYLMAYRNTAHNTTGQSPAMLLQKRSLRSRLDLLRSGSELKKRVENEQRKQVELAGGRIRKLCEGDKVWVRDYGNQDKWVKGCIEKYVGSRNVIVRKEDGLSSQIKRHIDQVRRRSPGILACPGPATRHSPASNYAGNTIDTDVSRAQHLPPGQLDRTQRAKIPIQRYGNPILY